MKTKLSVLLIISIFLINIFSAQAFASDQSNTNLLNNINILSEKINPNEELTNEICIDIITKTAKYIGKKATCIFDNMSIKSNITTKGEFIKHIVNIMDLPDKEISDYRHLIDNYYAIEEPYRTYLLKAYILGLISDDINIDMDEPITVEEASSIIVKVIFPEKRIKNEEKLSEIKKNYFSKPQEKILTSNDSVIFIKKDNFPNNNLICIEIKKREKIERIFCIPNKGSINKKIYLRFGPGLYLVRILQKIDNTTNHGGKYRVKDEYTVENTDERMDLEYLLPSDYIESDSEEIINLAKKITEGLSDDIEKSKAIHDWIAKNIAYDTGYINKPAKNFSALETLKLKKTLCNGYAKLNAALHRAIGIPTRVIAGTVYYSDKNEDKGGFHAWNEIYINGKWINVDVTRDAGYVNSKNKFIFSYQDKYFNIPDDVFSKTYEKMYIETY